MSALTWRSRALFPGQLVGFNETFVLSKELACIRSALYSGSVHDFPNLWSPPQGQGPSTMRLFVQPDTLPQGLRGNGTEYIWNTRI